jgi:cellobiose phosphorylase
MDIAATQFLLGIRPELDGLRLAPVLPAEWKGFSVTRRYRNCQCDIEVRRAGAGEKSGLNLAGRLLPGNSVPASALAGLARAKIDLIISD